ncbi:MAG: carboxypeptidase regulatory-like domain-containing protein, partial [Flavobacterium sp.]
MSKINGRVLTEANQPIMDANLVLKSKLGALISFKRSDKNGDFFFEIKDNIHEFVLETSYLGFQKDSQPIFLKENGATIIVIVSLKATVTRLAEINIASKPAAISIKNDTTTYKVSSFLTGNEEVVEDVLKKLPGIDVSENGKITYRGKSISRVLIEGDDLFTKNYQIGTKNLKSAILEEVQAIDNYVENEKLVGLKKTNETVLNLKIKEGAKNKPNLAVTVAHGYANAYKVDNNLIGVSKSLKYFLFNTINNVGANSTPYDYFNFDNTSEESLEPARHQKKIIEMDYSLPTLSPKRGNINQNSFSAGNAFIRLNKSLNLAANYNLYADKISLIKHSLTEFGKMADSVSFREHKVITKKPLIAYASFTILYDVSRKSNFSCSSTLSSKKIKHFEELTANYGAFASALRDKTKSLEQNLEYTSRLSTHSAFKIKANYLFINQPQNYSLSPSFNSVHANLNGQSIQLSGNFFAVTSEYFIKTKLLNHSFTLLYSNKKEDMRSHSLENKLYTNNLEKDDDLINFGYTNTLDLKRIDLSTGLFYKLKRSAMLGNERNALRNKINYLSPQVNLHYRWRKYDKFSVASSYDRFLPGLTDLYQNYIVVNNKSLSRGIYEKNVIGKYSLTTTLIHSDLLNQFIYFVNFIYVKNSKSYGSSQEIHPYYTLNNSAIFPGVENYVLTGSLSKYLPFMRSTVKYNHNLSWYTFYGQVNRSPIRNYSVLNSSQSIDFRSGFDEWFNFETGLKYSTAKFRFTSTKNHNVQFYSSFLLKPTEKLFFSMSNELYFNTITDNNYQNYFFLDVSTKYNLNKKTTLKF